MDDVHCPCKVQEFAKVHGLRFLVDVIESRGWGYVLFLLAVELKYALKLLLDEVSVGMLGSDWLDALELVAAICHSFSRLVLLLLLLSLFHGLGLFRHFLSLLKYFFCLHYGLFDYWFLFVNHKRFGYLLPFLLLLLYLLCLWLFRCLILFLVLPIVLDRKHFIILNAVLEQLHSFFPVKEHLCRPS